MRRLVSLLVAAALVASACGDGEPNLEVDAAPAEAVEATTEAPASTDAPAAADEADTADEEVAADDQAEEATATTTTIAPPPPPGREVLASLQDAGEPYVLWFWGAH